MYSTCQGIRLEMLGTSKSLNEFLLFRHSKQLISEYKYAAYRCIALLGNKAIYIHNTQSVNIISATEN